MSKELEDLLRRVSELEKQVKNGSFSAFGRSYSSIGSSSSDFVIKTKGQVKIQWGNKFIDLIKDGKINVNSKFIYTVDTSDNIGNKDGIYVTSNGSVYIKSGDAIINLVGEIGTTYVSFMEEQQTTSDQKYTALKNIGFIYDSLEQVDNTALQNGLIYIQDQHKIYLVRNGQLEEFKLEIPNPFTQQFVIQKSDSSQGALLIRGSGINNSLAFESLYLYVDEGNSYFDSEGNIEFIVDGDTIVNINKDRTTINNITQSNTFQSINADSDSGFRLYVENGESTLEVDNIIERNKKTSINVDVFPEFFSKRNNIIVSIEQVSDPERGSGFAIKLKYENQYKVGDYLYTYGEVQVNDFCTKLIKIPITVEILDTETSNMIYAQVVSGFSSEVDSLSEIPDLEGKVIFLVSSGEEIQQLRYSQNNIDLLKYIQFSEEQKKESIKSRIGNLTELGLNGKQDNHEVPIDGYGFYSEIGAFKQSQYTSDYNLPYNDNSTKFVSTEWIHKLLPYGTIIMYNGSSIPEGWAICDGTNGTPNLIDRFIVAGTSSGPSDDSNSMDYPFEINSSNVPVGNHTHQLSTSGESVSSSGSGEVSITIPSHTHKLKFVTTSKAKRVETGDGEGANNYHFGGVGSIYKGSEQWNAATGSGGIVTSSDWNGESLVQETGDQTVTGTFNINVSGSTSGESTETGGPIGGTSNVISLRPPRYYSLVFIMKVYPVV